MWPYLRAANSGHPGTLSTVHADTPEGAFTQLVFMMQQAGSTSSEEQIRSIIGWSGANDTPSSYMDSLVCLKWIVSLIKIN